jgi:hypothetical protein
VFYCSTFSILFIVWVLGYLGAPVKEEMELGLQTIASIRM